MVRNRQSQELYREVRLRMIRETEEFLEEWLESPDGCPRIPTMIVGRGSFTPRFAEAFWNQALGLSVRTESLLRRMLWRR